MPRKSGLDYILPYLDPEYDPNHPIHRLPPLSEDPHAPLGKRERKRLLDLQLQSALDSYTPPHVIRAWEVDAFRGKRHDEVLALRLSHGDYTKDGLLSPIGQSRRQFEQRYSLHDSSASRRGQSPYEPSEDPDHNDFRQFAVSALHLGYHRFHPSTSPEDSEIGDPLTTPPDEVCWIMEYTIHECTVIRRQIAHILGLYPAVMDKDTDAYDDDVAWKYERRLHARCRRFNKRCIRPAHITIFTASGSSIP